jgi:hypothetical protein
MSIDHIPRNLPIQLYPVHGVENIFMHDMNGQIHFGSGVGQFIGKPAERNRAFCDINQHNHSEKILHDRLGYFHNIHMVFRTDSRHPRKNTDHVFPDYGDYGSHKSFFLPG